VRVSVFQALRCAYPENVWSDLGIKAEWREDPGRQVTLILSDQYGRASSTNLELPSEKELLAGVKLGPLRGLRERIERAVEWHLEPPAATDELPAAEDPDRPEGRAS
jgi:hypothetical protein